MLATIRYKLNPDSLEENLRLLTAVYEELGSIEAEDLRWATFKSEDGITFMDIAMGSDIPSVLQRSDAFRRYRADLENRCDEPPVFSELTVVGSFRFPTQGAPLGRGAP